jgi:hypothetical protein
VFVSKAVSDSGTDGRETRWTPGEDLLEGDDGVVVVPVEEAHDLVDKRFALNVVRDLAQGPTDGLRHVPGEDLWRGRSIDRCEAGRALRDGT